MRKQHMRTVKKERQHELDRNDNAGAPPKGTISGFHPATNGLARPATSPKPFSFVDELRPADLELAPTLSTLPPPLPLQHVAPLAPPPLPTITDEPSFESYHSVDAQLEEYLANEAEPAHEADRDDRTVERYVPPSVEDLDYDSDQTTDMPPAWIDHLAASARPSNRPPPLADAQPASLVDKTNTSANNAPTLPPPAPVPALLLSSSPSPSAAAFVPPPPPRMLDVLAGVEASALGGSAFTAPPLSLPPMSPASSRSGAPSGQLAIPTPSQPLSVRSNPIPWNPTPPPEPRARKSRHMPLLLLAGGLVWLIALAVVLRWLLH